jgi:hypothetical protein
MHRVLIAASAQVAMFGSVTTAKPWILPTTCWLATSSRIPCGVPRRVGVGQKQWPLLVVELGQEPAPAPLSYEVCGGRRASKLYSNGGALKNCLASRP